MPCCALHLIANNLLPALSPSENPLSSLKILRSFSDQSSHLPSCRLNLGKLTMPFRLVSWGPPEVARLERLAEYAVGCAAGKTAIFKLAAETDLRHRRILCSKKVRRSRVANCISRRAARSLRESRGNLRR